jgi:hypothetical protein
VPTSRVEFLSSHQLLDFHQFAIMESVIQTLFLKLILNCDVSNVFKCSYISMASWVCDF